MGTIYGSVLGAVLFLSAQSNLQDLLLLASEAVADWPLLASLLSPDRWLLWLGLLFVLSVYDFPTGIVGVCAPRPFHEPPTLVKVALTRAHSFAPKAKASSLVWGPAAACAFTSLASVGQPCRCCSQMLANASIHVGSSFKHGM